MVISLPLLRIARVRRAIWTQVSYQVYLHSGSQLIPGASIFGRRQTSLIHLPLKQLCSRRHGTEITFWIPLSLSRQVDPDIGLHEIQPGSSSLFIDPLPVDMARSRVFGPGFLHPHSRLILISRHARSCEIQPDSSGSSTTYRKSTCRVRFRSSYYA